MRGICAGAVLGENVVLWQLLPTWKYFYKQYWQCFVASVYSTSCLLSTCIILQSRLSPLLLAIDIVIVTGSQHVCQDLTMTTRYSSLWLVWNPSRELSKNRHKSSRIRSIPWKTELNVLEENMEQQRHRITTSSGKWYRKRSILFDNTWKKS